MNLTPEQIRWVLDDVLEELAIAGSTASPGYYPPEGVVIFHTAGNLLFKKTIEKDEEYKSMKR